MRGHEPKSPRASAAPSAARRWLLGFCVLVLSVPVVLTEPAVAADPAPPSSTNPICPAPSLLGDPVRPGLAGISDGLATIVSDIRDDADGVVDVPGLGTPIAALADQLSAGLADSLEGISEVPLTGAEISTGLAPVFDGLATISSDLADLLDTIPIDTESDVDTNGGAPGGTVPKLALAQMVLFLALGPGTDAMDDIADPAMRAALAPFTETLGKLGLGLLVDGPDDGADVSPSDISFVSCLGVGPTNRWMQVELHLGQRIVTTTPSGEVALPDGLADVVPGLGASIAAPNGIRFDTRWDLRVGFGYQNDRARPIYLFSGASTAKVRDEAGTPCLATTGDPGPGGDGTTCLAAPRVPELDVKVVATAAKGADAASPRLVGEVGIGGLAAVATDGTPHTPTVTAHTGVTPTAIDGDHAAGVTVNGTTVTIRSDATTLADYLLDVNAQLASGFAAEWGPFPPVVLSATFAYLNATDSRPRLKLVARDPAVRSLSMTAGEALGFESGTQYGDETSRTLGFASGASQEGAGTLRAARPLPDGLTRDVDLLLHVGNDLPCAVGRTDCALLPIKISESLNRPITVAGTARGIHDRDELADHVAAVITQAVDASSNHPGQVAVALGAGGNLELTSSTGPDGRAAPDLAITYPTSEHSSVTFAAGVDLQRGANFDEGDFVRDYATGDPLFHDRVAVVDFKDTPETYLKPSVGVDAKLRLHVDADADALGDAFSAPLGPGIELGLPSVRFDLKLDGTAKVEVASGTQKRTVAFDGVTFDNVTLDLGDLARNVVQPIASLAAQILEPVASVLSPVQSTLLDTRLEPISAIADTDVTLGGIIESDGTAGEVLAAIKALVKSVAGAGAVVDQLLAMGELNVGCIRVKGDVLDGRPVPCVLSSIAQELSAAAVEQFLSNRSILVQTEGGLIVDAVKPMQLFNLVTGRRADLVSYRLRDINGSSRADLGFSYSDKLSFEIGAQLRARAALGLVYDTTGIDAVGAAIAAGLTPDPSQLLEGLYLTAAPDQTFDLCGHPVTLSDIGLGLCFDGEGNADLSTPEFCELGVCTPSVEIFYADVTAKLGAHVGLDLVDPDHNGRLTYAEISDATNGLRQPENLFCLFDVRGGLYSDIGGTVRIGGVEVASGEIGLDTGTLSLQSLLSALFGFCESSPSASPPPILASPATAHDGSDVLRVNTGPFAGARQYEDTSDVGRALTIRIAGTARDVEVTVLDPASPSATLSTPLSQRFTGTFDRIVIPGTAGADTIDASQSPLPVEVIGAAGDDVITGSRFADVLDGASGADRITGGGGDDLLEGGSGGDVLDGGDGDDRLLGESGDDDLRGGAGDDHLDGGSGTDVLDGASGADRLVGGSGPDTLRGQTGADSLDGGAGDDVLEGGDEADVLVGGSGSDRLDGGAADDVLDGGYHDDVLIGGAGDDALDGGAGSDDLDGGEGGDVVNGGAGSDVLVGSAGADALNGGSGADRVTGNGDDALAGGTGNDVLTPMASDRFAAGGAGSDVLHPPVDAPLAVSATAFTSGAASVGYTGVERIVITDAGVRVRIDGTQVPVELSTAASGAAVTVRDLGAPVHYSGGSDGGTDALTLDASASANGIVGSFDGLLVHGVVGADLIVADAEHQPDLIDFLLSDGADHLEISGGPPTGTVTVDGRGGDDRVTVALPADFGDVVVNGDGGTDVLRVAFDTVPSDALATSDISGLGFDVETLLIDASLHGAEGHEWSVQETSVWFDDTRLIADTTGAQVTRIEVAPGAKAPLTVSDAVEVPQQVTADGDTVRVEEGVDLLARRVTVPIAADLFAAREQGSASNTIAVDAATGVLTEHDLNATERAEVGPRTTALGTWIGTVVAVDVDDGRAMISDGHDLVKLQRVGTTWQNQSHQGHDRRIGRLVAIAGDHYTYLVEDDPSDSVDHATVVVDERFDLTERTELAVGIDGFQPAALAADAQRIAVGYVPTSCTPAGPCGGLVRVYDRDDPGSHFEVHDTSDPTFGRSVALDGGLLAVGSGGWAPVTGTVEVGKARVFEVTSTGLSLVHEEAPAAQAVSVALWAADTGSAATLAVGASSYIRLVERGASGTWTTALDLRPNEFTPVHGTHPAPHLSLTDSRLVYSTAFGDGGGGGSAAPAGTNVVTRRHTTGWTHERTIGPTPWWPAGTVSPIRQAFVDSHGAYLVSSNEVLEVVDPFTGAADLAATSNRGAFSNVALAAVPDRGVVSAAPLTFASDAARKSFEVPVRDTSGRALLAPTAVASQPDGERFWAAGDGQLAWFTFDAATGEAVQGGVIDLGVGGLPVERIVATATQNGHALYVFVPAANELILVSVSAFGSHHVVSRVGLFDQPSDVVVAPDGGHLYLADAATSSVHVYERSPSGGTLGVRTTTMIDGARGVVGLEGVSDLAITPDGRYVLAAGTADDSIVVFETSADGSTMRPVQRLRNGSSGITNLAAPTMVGVMVNGGQPYVTVGSRGRGVGQPGGIVVFDVKIDAPPGRTLIVEHAGFRELHLVSSTSGDGFSIGEPDASVFVEAGDGDDRLDVAKTSWHNLDADLGAGSDAVQIRSTGDGPAVLRIDLGDGDDEARIDAVASYTELSLDSGTGDDVVEVVPRHLLGRFSTSGEGHELADTLVVDEPDLTTLVDTSGAPFTSPPVYNSGYLAAAGTQSSGGGGVSYNTFEALEYRSAPIARAGAERRTSEGVGVSFDATGTVVPGGVTVEATWDVDGDGDFDDAFGLTPHLSWSNLVDLGIDDDGEHVVTLRAHNVADPTLSTTASVTLTVVNVAPVPSLHAVEPTVFDGEPATFALSTSDPGADTPRRFVVDWDGPGGGAPVEINGNPSQIAHTYDRPGTYTVVLSELSDEDGTYPAGETATVTVVAVPPLELAGAATVDEGSPYTLNLTGPSATEAPFEVDHWIVSWGDGTVEEVAGTSASVGHVFDGPATVTITALAVSTDGTRRPAANDVDVEVGMILPIVDRDGAASIPEGDPYELSFAAIDPGDDTISSFTVDWGDGTVEVLAGSATGARHVYAEPADVTIQVTATDEDGTGAARPLPVTVTNRAPVVAAARFAPDPLDEGGTATITVVATDPGGGPVTIAFDLDDDGVYGEPGEPVGDDGRAHRHFPDDVAGATIGFRAVDAQGAATTGSLTIPVRNVAPSLAVRADRQRITAGPDVAPLVIDDGDELTVQVAAIDPGTDTVTSYVIDWGDGTAPERVDAAGEPTHVYALAPTATEDAHYTVTVSAPTDEDGTYPSVRVAFEVTVTWRDRLAPDTRVAFADPDVADALAPGDDLDAVFSGEDRPDPPAGTAAEHLRYRCLLDGDPVHALVTNPGDPDVPLRFDVCLPTAADFDGLSEGTHRLEVVAVDQAGNVDPTPATIVFQVGTEGGPATTVPPSTTAPPTTTVLTTPTQPSAAPTTIPPSHDASPLPISGARILDVLSWGLATCLLGAALVIAAARRRRGHAHGE